MQNQPWTLPASQQRTRASAPALGSRAVEPMAPNLEDEQPSCTTGCTQGGTGGGDGRGGGAGGGGRGRGGGGGGGEGGEGGGGETRDARYSASHSNSPPWTHFARARIQSGTFGAWSWSRHSLIAPSRET